MKVSVENRQDALSVSAGLISSLEKAGVAALLLIKARGIALGQVPEEVAVALVDDVMIAEVHGQYMDDPTPTDVITFPYGESGELLISVETAELQRKDYGTLWENEIALYLVHGILHLCGYEDTDEVGRARMDELQSGLLKEVFGADEQAN
jgi:probable rRNA maturation factor